MASVAILARTFLHRPRWGTALFYDRHEALLARDERTARWRAVRAGVRPGWWACKAAEAVADVVAARSLVSRLALLCCLPRLAALVAAELGLGMDQVFRLSGALLLASEELCRQQFACWPEER